MPFKVVTAHYTTGHKSWRRLDGIVGTAKRVEIAFQHPIALSRSLDLSPFPCNRIDRLSPGLHFFGREHPFQMEETCYVKAIIFVRVHSSFRYSFGMK